MERWKYCSHVCFPSTFNSGLTTLRGYGFWYTEGSCARRHRNGIRLFYGHVHRMRSTGVRDGEMRMGFGEFYQKPV